MNKPLTKQEREYAEFLLRDQLSAELAEKAIGDAAYWREAVKNCKAEVDCGASSGMGLMCVFCEGEDTQMTIVSGDGIVVHHADCPWKLAQE